MFRNWRVRGPFALALLWLFGQFAFAQQPLGASPLSIDQQAAKAFSQGQFDEAAKLYREAVKQRPDWAEGWGYLAASLFNLKRYDEAREAYTRTAVLTPQNGPSWAFRGFCEYELRDYRHAFDHLVKAEQLGLGSSVELVSRVHYELALLWDTAGQFDMAMKEIAFLATAGDKSPPVIEATGLIVLRMPLFPNEVPAVKHELVMKVGEAGWQVNAQHIEEARQLYKDLVTQHPREPNLHYAYGFALAASDQEAAVAELEKELELNPKHVSALIEAAFLCVEMGQFDKSERLARRAIVIEPKNYAPHNILGRVLVQRGQLDRGIQELETAVRLAPSIPSVHFNLAQAYQKAGNSAAAGREFATFRSLDEKQKGENAEGEQHP
jgi:tetratricopeptide (TPR) repeat protein